MRNDGVLPWRIYALFALSAVFSAVTQAQPTDREPENEPAPRENVPPIPRADEASATPRAGEIQLEGTIEKVEGDSLVLRAASFTLPSGKKSTLAAPKPKEVRLSGAIVCVQGDPLWRLSAGDVEVGVRAIVVGRDAGSGRELPARAIVLDRELGGARRDFFVAQGGGDEGDGSPQKPWRSIQKALERVPDGTARASRVLHIGPGVFSQADGTVARLSIKDKKYLTITGAGARPDGTQIATGDFAKSGSGLMRISNSIGLRLCNLIIGDDRAWDNKDAFFEATVRLDAGSEARFEAVHILGPSRQTTLEANSNRAPTALAATDRASRARLQNVLVTGHGSFLSNPEGRVECRNVTFARMFGVNYDDNFLFLQTPLNALSNQRRFTFQDCLLYELQGHRGGRPMLISAGETGEDKAFWDAPRARGGGSFVVRAHLSEAGSMVRPSQLQVLFPTRRANRYTIAHGVWQDDDPTALLSGALQVSNTIELSDRDGFPFASPILVSGWQGGFAGEAQAPEVEEVG